MKPVSPCRLRILAILRTIAFAATAAAQNSTGSIQGAVRDQTDAILPGLDFPTVEAYPRYPTPSEERHRVVASGILGLPWDTRVSTFITYGSGLPYTITDASLGFGPNQLKVLRNEGRADSYQSFDLRLEKTVGFGGPHRLGLVAEVFNAFNHFNYTDYNEFIPPRPEVNGANFSQPGRLMEPGRRFQFGRQLLVLT